MIDAPVIRIACRRASEVKLGHRTRQGVLIGDNDVKTLRLLAGRDIHVSLIRDGTPIYEARIRDRLRRMIYLPETGEWYVPTTSTGPLKPPRLSHTSD